MAPTSTTAQPAAAAVADAPRGNRWRGHLVTLASGVWMLGLTWWVSENMTRLRMAETLILLEGFERGAPLTADDHLTDFPEVYAEFTALGLLGNTSIIWVFALAAFAVVGLVIAGLAVWTDPKPKRTLLAGMAGTWVMSVITAWMNSETLALLTWLNN